MGAKAPGQGLGSFKIDTCPFAGCMAQFKIVAPDTQHPGRRGIAAVNLSEGMQQGAWCHCMRGVTAVSLCPDPVEGIRFRAGDIGIDKQNARTSDKIDDMFHLPLHVAEALHAVQAPRLDALKQQRAKAVVASPRVAASE